MERSDDLGEALLDGHPACVASDEFFDAAVGVVGDDDGGGVAAQPGDDQLTHGGGVVRQAGGRFVDSGPVVAPGAVQGDRLVVGRAQAVDVAQQGG